MRIKSEQFCAIATSPSWQAWLYNYNSALYKQFMEKLATSTGCAKNREIMLPVLDQIGLMGGTDQLADFLSKNYPHVIDDSPVAPAPVAVERVVQAPVPVVRQDEVFVGYRPGILTYPRRTIITGGNLIDKATEFMSDKIKSDLMIVNDKAYIEYLTSDDKDIMSSIPAKNWQIAAYRARNHGKR